MFGEEPGLLGAGKIDQSDGVVKARCGRQLAAGRNGDATYRLRMDRELVLCRAGCQIPVNREAIISGGEDMSAVGTEGDAAHPASVPAQRLVNLHLFEIPVFHKRIHTARESALAVRRDCQANNIAFVGVELSRLFEIDQVPDAYLSARRGCKSALAVW